MGINAWYFTTPLLMVVMMLTGSTRYRLDETGKKIRVRDPQKALVMMAAMAIVCSTITVVLIVAESSESVEQWIFNNLTGNESWTIVWMTMFVMMVYIVCFALFYLSDRLGGFLTKYALSQMIWEEKHAWRKEPTPDATDVGELTGGNTTKKVPAEVIPFGKIRVI